MTCNNLKPFVRGYLLYGLLLLSSCDRPDENTPKTIDLTQTLIQNWQETLESELIEPSGLWIPFSPEANMDSLIKVFNSDTTLIKEQ